MRDTLTIGQLRRLVELTKVADDNTPVYYEGEHGRHPVQALRVDGNDPEQIVLVVVGKSALFDGSVPL